MKRKTSYAGSFYPDDKEQCLTMFNDFEDHMGSVSCVDKDKDICCGIVPHAGWLYSGAVAYTVFRALSKSVVMPETFVIFGAVHVPGVSKVSIWAKGVWETVLGDILIDEVRAAKIVEYLDVDCNEKHHLREHSIEVLLPFIKYFFPKTRIIPIMVPVTKDSSSLGKEIGNLFPEKDTIALCSTDLTHYGTRFDFYPKGLGEKALSWVKNENDKRIIDLMLKLKDNEIIKEVRENQNACGGGAIAATLAFAKTRKKEYGELLSYLTSWDIHKEKNIDNFVGYTGIII